MQTALLQALVPQNIEDGARFVMKCDFSRVEANYKKIIAASESQKPLTGAAMMARVAPWAFVLRN